MSRLVASYVLLAIITLGGAGLLLETMLSQRLAEADEMELKSKLDGAARVAGMQLLLNPDQTTAQIEAELHKTYPYIQVEPATALLTTDSYWIYDVVPVQRGSSGPPYRTVSLVVSRSPDQPHERIVQVVELNQPRSGLRVSWPDQERIRSRALGQGLLGAGLLSFCAALAMAVWFSRTLTAPLGRVARAAGLLAEGRWDVPLPEGGLEEVRHLSAAFKTMAARLESDFLQLKGEREKLQALGAELAHELKTPIATLRTYHELLLDGEQENPVARQQLLERGAAQVARLEYLAHFLVDMARLQAHSAPLNLQQVDLGALVRQAVAAIEPVARQRAVLVVSTVPAQPVPILADPQRIGQALDNLLQNAVRWSSAKGTVQVAVTATATQAEVAVADEGPGIAPDVLPRLFEPFVRGEGSGGLGLGLAIVQAVAQSHGGAATAANRPEGGARFLFTLPIDGVK
jgi:signal transduction histidine kinase